MKFMTLITIYFNDSLLIKTIFITVFVFFLLQKFVIILKSLIYLKVYYFLLEFFLFVLKQRKSKIFLRNNNNIIEIFSYSFR